MLTVCLCICLPASLPASLPACLPACLLHQVAVNYASSPDKAEEVAAEITKLGGEAITIGCNVAKRDELDAMFKAVTDKWGQVDVLVNNAGGVEGMQGLGVGIGVRLRVRVGEAARGGSDWAGVLSPAANTTCAVST